MLSSRSVPNYPKQRARGRESLASPAPLLIILSIMLYELALILKKNIPVRPTKFGQQQQAELLFLTPFAMVSSWIAKGSG